MGKVKDRCIGAFLILVSTALIAGIMAVLLIPSKLKNNYNKLFLKSHTKICFFF